MGRVVNPVRLSEMLLWGEFFDKPNSHGNIGGCDVPYFSRPRRGDVLLVQDIATGVIHRVVVTAIINFNGEKSVNFRMADDN